MHTVPGRALVSSELLAKSAKKEEVYRDMQISEESSTAVCIPEHMYLIIPTTLYLSLFIITWLL